jgi:L-alanine-DL-glutamate epimerase-like enolase superfamily enzyme
MSRATIRSVQCLRMRLPFHHWADPPLFAGRPRSTLDSALVRVELDNGLVGWGEAYGGELDATAAMVAARVAPLACGRDATDMSLTHGLERTLHNLGRSGPLLHALSGLDIALWDLRGKLEGVPLYQLLGGAKRTRIAAYGSLLQYCGNVENVRRNVQRALDAGFGQVKLHERTVESVAAARDVAGAAVPLMVDTNCAWHRDEAIRAVQAMAAFSPLWVEEPIWPPEDHDALVALKAATGVPLATGENATSRFEFERLLACGAADYLQPSAIKSGGVSLLHDVSRACSASGRRFSPQSAFFGPGFLATLHVLAAHPQEMAAERIYCELGHTPYAATVPMERGAFTLTDQPGLGADPEPELLEGPFIQ